MARGVPERSGGIICPGIAGRALGVGADGVSGPGARFGAGRSSVSCRVADCGLTVGSGSALGLLAGAAWVSVGEGLGADQGNMPLGALGIDCGQPQNCRIDSYWEASLCSLST